MEDFEENVLNNGNMKLNLGGISVNIFGKNVDNGGDSNVNTPHKVVTTIVNHNHTRSFDKITRDF